MTLSFLKVLGSQTPLLQLNPESKIPMQFNPLTSEIIIEFLQKKLYLSEYRTLSLQEEMIIKGIIDQHSYEKIAHQIYLSPGTTRNIASQLFRHLSTLFKTKITKKNFGVFIEKMITNKEDFIDELENYTPTCLETNSAVILLIDDQLENLLLLKQILSQNNYIVRTIKNGRTALELIDKINPNLILLDILMPEIDGYGVCKTLKENPQYKEIPIIFLSAISDLNDKVKAFSLGASDYITKPFEPVEVLARVSYQIELQSQRRALKTEIESHQKTIESLTQSRSILASLLNYAPYGIAALSAIRSPETGEVIDFEFILVNPIFIKLFPADSELIKSGSSCVSFLQKKQLDWLPKLINLVTAGQPFSEIINLASQIIEVHGTKLGDGVSITLHPIVNHF